MEGGSSQNIVQKEPVPGTPQHPEKSEKKVLRKSLMSRRDNLYINQHYIVYILIGRETMQVHSLVSHNNLDLDNISHQYDYKYMYIYIHMFFYSGHYLVHTKKNTPPNLTLPSPLLGYLFATHNPQPTSHSLRQAGLKRAILQIPFFIRQHAIDPEADRPQGFTEAGGDPPAVMGWWPKPLGCFSKNKNGLKTEGNFLCDFFVSGLFRETRRKKK